MHPAALKQFAIRAAQNLPGSACSFPFGPEYEVFKVGGKVFMMTTEVPGPQVVTLKSDPGRSLILREIFPSITPGYHMNKRHWISIVAGPEISEELIADLVEHSYSLVVRGLTRLKRPSD